MQTMNQFYAPSLTVLSARTIVFMVIAGVTTFAIFALMQAMIKQDTNVITPAAPPVFIDPVFKEHSEKVITRTTPKPQPKPTTPPVAPKEVPDTTSEPTGIEFVPPQIQTVGGGFKAISMGNSNSELRPIVRVDPRYPNDAAREGIEGWVELQFNVDKTGSVTDVNVIKAQPKRVFDSAARRALLRWKYKPAMRDGQPITQTGLSVVLEFSLADS